MNVSVDRQRRRSRRSNRFPYKLNDAVAGHDTVVWDDSVGGDEAIAGEWDVVDVGGNEAVAGDDAFAGGDADTGHDDVAGNQVGVDRDSPRLVLFSNSGVGQERGKGSCPRS